MESHQDTGNSATQLGYAEQDCFPVDATWDSVKKDYDKLPTQWDCSVIYWETQNSRKKSLLSLKSSFIRSMSGANSIILYSGLFARY